MNFDHYSINRNQNGQIYGVLVMESLKPLNKFIRMMFPNGDKFDIPVTTIADSRAMYYGTVNHKHDKKLYKEEFEYSMRHDEELIDWLQNNMNWEDVKDVAVKVVSVNYDYDENWSEACFDSMIEK